MKSSIYIGELIHSRFIPIKHSFKYRHYFFGFDLSELDLLDNKFNFFGHNKFRLFSLYDRDYLGLTNGTIREKLVYWLKKEGYKDLFDRVKLFTTPRVFGHTFNPVSFYFCYSKESFNPQYIIVEVNNTFGEGHIYILTNGKYITKNKLQFTHKKEFHVSPMNDMKGVYNFEISMKKNIFDVSIEIFNENEIWFSARLIGNPKSISNKALFLLFLRYPVNALLILPRILRIAAVLHFIKRLPIFRKPDPISKKTFLGTYPAYLSEFWAKKKR